MASIILPEGGVDGGGGGGGKGESCSELLCSLSRIEVCDFFFYPFLSFCFWFSFSVFWFGFLSIGFWGYFVFFLFLLLVLFCNFDSFKDLIGFLFLFPNLYTIQIVVWFITR